MSKLANLENPIRNIGKRDDIEVAIILENLNLFEIENNEFTDKYEIYYEYYVEGVKNKKIIQGYVIDYIFNNNEKNTELEKRYFEFLFVDVENNFYFFEFTDFYSRYVKSENIEYFCYKRNWKKLRVNHQFLNSSSLTIQNKYNNLFDKFDICGPTNLKLVFDFNLGKENFRKNNSILENIKKFYEIIKFVNIENFACENHLLEKYTGFVLDKI
jgi:hypothetical protein